MRWAGLALIGFIQHGIWFGSLDGIYLYAQAHGLVKVSNQPGYPANGCI
jgi:hypothetical protein